MVYIRIYWKETPDALKALMEKYATHPDVKQVGYDGLEIVLNNEDVVKDIKKFCRYRTKKLVIEEIDHEFDFNNDWEEEILNNGENLDLTEEDLEIVVTDDEVNDNLEEEILLLNNNMNIDLTGEKFFSSFDYIVCKYDDEPDPDIMDFYKYPDCQATCDCDYDECTCEVERIKQEIIAQLLIEGRYKSICGYSWRRKELEKMKNYY